MHHFYSLPSRRIIQVTGSEVRPFLQGLLTVDVLKLAETQLRYGLLLSPQGKFLHDMFVVPQGDDLLLDVDVTQAETLLKRLKLYKLKRQVAMDLTETWRVIVAVERAAPLPVSSEAVIAADPRLPEMGARAYVPTALVSELFEHVEDNESAYLARRVALTVPEGIDMIPEKSFALDFDMDDLHAVDYTKGCYVGQEVTARMHYRGVGKKGVYHIATKDGTLLPQAGTEIICDGKSAGVLTSVCQSDAMAMLRHEMVSTGALFADTLAIHATRPPWAKPVANVNEESL